MVVTGSRRWLALFFCAFVGGIMVYVPYLRFSYYDQMVTLFSVSTNIADPSHVNEYIGNVALVEAVVCMVGYPIAGFLTDIWSEKWMLISGGIIMGVCSIWFGFLPGSMGIYIINFLYGIGVILIFSPMLVVNRKLGKSTEQGTMYSICETVRSLTGTALGFIAVALFNQAVINGETDPTLLVQKWKMALCIDGVCFFIGCIGIFFTVPANLIAAETTEPGYVEPPKATGSTLQNVVRVLKLPGTWLMILLIFCAYNFVSCGSGYLGTYSVQILGISTTVASTLAVIRNYIIAIFATLSIGIVADKVGLKSKTLGIYIGGCAVLTALMLTLGGLSVALSIVISLALAFMFMGMKGIYFATMGELGIPVELSGICTGVVSLLCYTPDVYFSKLAGGWLDKFGNTGFTYIWIYAIVCGVAGVIVSIIAVRYARKVAKNK